ncbi:MAG: heparan-alpha-glucosaminide N-acetyltransferase domain-containing protein [Bryobacteraceae bacterium]
MATPSQPESNPASSSSPKVSRLAFLDWTRGLAAVIMLQGHVFHSFARTDLRNQDAFILSQFVGGMPPAIFLFLTGVTLAFLMESTERKGVAGWDRVWISMRRAGYLFALAIAFRLQLYLFGMPQNDIGQLFRVDILNCMGFGIAAVSVMALFTTLERVRLCAILGLAIAGISPLIASLDSSAIHPFLRAYFVPGADNFSFFPWGAFLAFGLSAGSVLRLSPASQLKEAMQWGAWLGLVLVIAAQYFSNLPYSLYPKSDFWLDSPGLVLIKLGVILMLLAFAYLWNTYMVTGWSWVRQLGTTSLLIYWVHTELVYGRWLSYWKEGLSTPLTVLVAALVIASMLGLSVARTRWPQIKEAIWPSSTALPEAD